MKTLPRTMVLLGCLLMTSALGSAQTPQGAPQSVRARSESATQALESGAVRSETSLEAPPSALKMFRGGPLRFEKNAGQFDPQVRFASRGLAHTLFLTPHEAVLVLTRQEAAPRGPKGRERIQARPAATTQTVARFKLAGANLPSQIEGEDQLPGRSNYLIGRDRSAWHTGVANFSRVRYRNVYPGVDWVYYGNEGQVEHDFVVSPGADPSQIVLEVAIDGSKSDETIRVSPEGDLILASQPEGIRFHRPVAYQMSDGQRQLVSANYAIKASGRVGFELGPYDPSRPIIIDPVLTFSTYLGGSDTNAAFSLAVDTTGIYVAGQTRSGDFPTTSGAVQQTPGSGIPNCASAVTPNVCFDAFVSKLSPDGTTLIYSTFLGGSALDGAFGIAVDGNHNAYVTGSTYSSDFPLPVPPTNAFQQNIASGSCQDSAGGTITCQDIFLAVLNNLGTALTYSTYVGGSGTEFANSVAVDSTGKAYITGFTESSNFPVTTSLAGGGTCTDGTNTFPCGDAFLGKFDPAAAGAASLVYLRFIGGNGDDFGNFVAVQNSTGNAFVVGETDSNTLNTNSFPIQGGFQSTFGGGFVDGFIAKVDSTGSGILYSSFLGGNDVDSALGIALDSTGKAYVTGYTRSSNFQVKSAFQATRDASNCATCYDAFVTKVDTALTGASSLGYSTYLGGSNDDGGFAVAVDSSANVYVTGGTTSKESDTKPFPLQSPLQPNQAGLFDIFVSKLNSAGSALTFSTYIGGAGTEIGSAIAVGSSGEIVIAGRTDSSDFPVTLDSLEPTPQGFFDDAFIVKIDTANLPAAAFSTNSLALGSIGVGFTTGVQSVVLSNMGSAPLTMSIATTGTNGGDFNVASSSTCGGSLAGGSKCQIDVTLTPTATGARNGFLTVSDNASGSPHDIALAGTGTVAPKVGLSTNTLAFGSVPFPSTSTLSVTLTNTGGANLVVSAETVSPTDYTKSADTCLLAPITPGNSCTISVTFTPSADGLIGGSITITDNAPGSPRTVALTGTGVSPTASLSTPTLAFGSQLVGTTSTGQNVTVTNNGSADLVISTVAASPADYTKSADTCQGATVTPTNSCIVSVTFTPTATGSRPGTLTFTDNAPGSPHVVSLTGTGTVDFTVTPGATSATVNAGATADFTLTLAPLGGFNQSISFTCSGAPVRSTCNPPAATALDGANSKDVTLSVVTQSRTAAPPGVGPFTVPPLTAPQGYLPWLTLWMLLATASIALAGKRRRTWLLLATTLLLALFWTACGGGGGGGGGTPPPKGTPAGTYTITVRATSVSITKTTTLSLKVN